MRRLQLGAGPACPDQAFDMNAGLKFGFGGHRQTCPQLPKAFCTIWQTLSRIARGRLGMRRVAALSQRVSLLGNRNAVAATLLNIRTVPELGSTRAQLETEAAAPRHFLHAWRRREARGPSERAPRRASLQTMLASTATLPGRYSSSAFVIAHTASSTTRTETNRLGRRESVPLSQLEHATLRTVDTVHALDEELPAVAIDQTVQKAQVHGDQLKLGEGSRRDGRNQRREAREAQHEGPVANSIRGSVVDSSRVRGLEEAEKTD